MQSRRTVKVDSALDDVVSENIAVCEVLGNNGSLGVSMQALCGRTSGQAHLWLVLLCDVGNTGADGCRARGGGKHGRFRLFSRGCYLEVGAVKLSISLQSLPS